MADEDLREMDSLWGVLDCNTSGNVRLNIQMDVCSLWWFFPLIRFLPRLLFSKTNPLKYCRYVLSPAPDINMIFHTRACSKTLLILVLFAGNHLTKCTCNNLLKITAKNTSSLISFSGQGSEIRMYEDSMPDGWLCKCYVYTHTYSHYLTLVYNLGCSLYRHCSRHAIFPNFKQFWKALWIREKQDTGIWADKIQKLRQKDVHYRGWWYCWGLVPHSKTDCDEAATISKPRWLLYVWMVVWLSRTLG